jgi:hypothetical protein
LTGRGGSFADLAQNLRSEFSVVQVEIARRCIAVLAAALFGHSPAAAMADRGNRVAVLLLVLLLKHLPVRDIALGIGWQQKRRSRINTELPVMRWTIFGWLQFHLSRTGEHLLEHRDNRGQIIECEMPTEPANEFQQIILHVGSSLFFVW